MKLTHRLRPRNNCWDFHLLHLLPHHRLPCFSLRLLSLSLVVCTCACTSKDALDPTATPHSSQSCTGSRGEDSDSSAGYLVQNRTTSGALDCNGSTDIDLTVWSCKGTWKSVCLYLNPTGQVQLAIDRVWARFYALEFAIAARDTGIILSLIGQTYLAIYLFWSAVVKVALWILDSDCGLLDVEELLQSLVIICYTAVDAQSAPTLLLFVTPLLALLSPFISTTFPSSWSASSSDRHSSSFLSWPECSWWGLSSLR